MHPKSLTNKISTLTKQKYEQLALHQPSTKWVFNGISQKKRLFPRVNNAAKAR
jgi:hypothetical protein